MHFLAKYALSSSIGVAQASHLEFWAETILNVPGFDYKDFTSNLNLSKHKCKRSIDSWISVGNPGIKEFKDLIGYPLDYADGGQTSNVVGLDQKSNRILTHSGAVYEVLMENKRGYKKEEEKPEYKWAISLETFDAFLKQLNAFDFHYNYSDDQKVWRRGKDQEAAIDILCENNEYKMIYDIWVRRYLAKGDRVAIDQTLQEIRTYLK